MFNRGGSGMQNYGANPLANNDMVYPFPMHNNQGPQQGGGQYPLMGQPLPYQNYQSQAPPSMSGRKPRFSRPQQQSNNVASQAPKAVKRKQESLTCDVCGVECNSQQIMDNHIRGQKHLKKLKQKASATVSTNNVSSSSSAVPMQVKNGDEQKPVILTPPTTTTVTAAAAPAASVPAEPTLLPPPVESPAKKAPVEKGALMLLNELARFNKVSAKYEMISESGMPHCKQFEVRLTLGDETYTAIGTSIKRGHQAAAEQALRETKLKMPASSTSRLPPAPRTRGVPRGGGGATPTGRGAYSNVRPPFNQSRNSNFRGGFKQQSPHTANQQQFRYQQGSQQQRGGTGESDNVWAIHDLLLQYITLKCEQVSEDEKIIYTLHRIVERIERALKTVSDMMMETAKAADTQVTPKLPEKVKLTYEDQNNVDPSESFRMLKGAMKTGVLAMRLFLKHDRVYTLALICANKPTASLLSEVSRELKVALDAQSAAAAAPPSTDTQDALSVPPPTDEPMTFEVAARIDEACLLVTSSALPEHTIRIGLTSPVFRNENFLNLDDETRQQIVTLNPEPADMLDKAKCLMAAAEIRHSNFFTGCMLDRRADSIVLRVLRDLQRTSPLSYLNQWCLALLVFKSQCGQQQFSSPAVLIRSVFSCLSAGVILPDNMGVGLRDPCEKEPVDAAGYLTAEQRMTLTSYAQEALRLIAFQEAHKVFNMDKIVLPAPVQEQQQQNGTSANGGVQGDATAATSNSSDAGSNAMESDEAAAPPTTATVG